MSGMGHRRVVTGLNAEGRSCVIIDGPVPRRGGAANLVWRTPAVPADNAGTADAAAPYDMAMLHDGGTNFLLTELPPGAGGDAFMHATDTIDYLVMLSGAVVLVLETGEVTLRAGDLIVDRGVVHGWRNDGDVSAVFCSVTMPAHPVGKDGRCDHAREGSAVLVVPVAGRLGAFSRSSPFGARRLFGRCRTFVVAGGEWRFAVHIGPASVARRCGAGHVARIARLVLAAVARLLPIAAPAAIGRVRRAGHVARIAGFVFAVAAHGVTPSLSLT
jgi:mannose-6-phosphate isomerase-like protein (cupin superfamily)